MKPLCEIISNPPTADIPFTGLQLATTTTTESAAAALTLASGSIVCAHVNYPADPVYTTIVLQYTDAAGAEFISAAVAVGASVRGVALIELANGTVGMVYIRTASPNYYLDWRTVSATGTAIANGSIANWTDMPSDPALVLTAAGEYLLVYARATVMYKRTATVFGTFGAEAALTTGTTGTLRNPALVCDSTDTLWLWYDHVDSITDNKELRNLYYQTSSDDGATWGAKVKHTDYASLSSVAIHPALLQKTANELTLLYSEEASLLLASPGGHVVSMTHNPVANTLNLFMNNNIVILWDIATWTEADRWSTATIPALDAYNGNFFISGIGTSLIPLAGAKDAYGAAGDYIDLLDIDSDIIRKYNFATSANRVKNITWSPEDPFTQYDNYMVSVALDEANQRLWLYRHVNYAFIYIGYIDLSDIGPAYTFNRLIFENATIGADQLPGKMLLVPTESMLIVGYISNSGSEGQLRIWSMTNGALIRHYTPASSGWLRSRSRYPRE